MKKSVWVNASDLYIPGQPEKKTIVDCVLNNKKAFDGKSIDVTEMQKQRRFRRNDRFSTISQIGLDAYKESFFGEDENRNVATVFNTTFGPINTNLGFIESIHDPESVPSPTAFSHTVNNAAIGHLCKDYSLKGPSTLLLSSDAIGLAQRILEEDMAEMALVQGVEEYCESLQPEYEKKGIDVVEAVSRVMLGTEKREGATSSVVAGQQTNLWGNPLLDEKPEVDAVAKAIANTCEEIEDKENIDLFLFNTFDSEIAENVKKSAAEINKDARVINLYDSLGVQLGADLCAQVVVADWLIKEGIVKAGHYCVVNSMDLSGNDITYIIKAME